MSLTTMENNMCTTAVCNSRGEVIASYSYNTDKYICAPFDWISEIVFSEGELVHKEIGSIREVNNAIEEIEVI